MAVIKPRENTAEEQQGPFEGDTSGHPRRSQNGVRNRTPRAIEALLEDASEALTRKLIDNFEIVVGSRWPTVQDIRAPRWSRVRAARRCVARQATRAHRRERRPLRHPLHAETMAEYSRGEALMGAREWSRSGNAASAEQAAPGLTFVKITLAPEIATASPASFESKH